MEYKQFVVKAFEREPGKWRASVERANGKVLLRAMARRRRALDKFITGMDATAAEAAMRMAMAAIDANAFSRISYRDKRQARAALNDIETLSERTDARQPVDASAWPIETEAAYSPSSPSVLPVDRLTRCTRVHTGQVTLS